MTSPLTEKTNFGATVEKVEQPQASLQTKSVQDDAISEFSSIAPPSTPPALTNREGANPFASVPTTPLDDANKRHLEVNTYDLEAGHTPLSAATTVMKVSEDGRIKECKVTMWPSKQSLIADAKASKRQRRCRYDPMRNLNKKQKLIAKILICFLIAALAVGLGVGISRAVGGGVWAGRGSNKEIPNDGKSS